MPTMLAAMCVVRTSVLDFTVIIRSIKNPDLRNPDYNPKSAPTTTLHLDPNLNYFHNLLPNTDGASNSIPHHNTLQQVFSSYTNPVASRIRCIVCV